MNSRYDAVLLIGFGGPTGADEVRPFLNQVLSGRPVVRDRYEEVVRHYELMGGRSPYNEHVEKQAAALRAQLRGRKAEIPVYVGMRNWAPHLAQAVAEIALSGARRVLGFVLAPHRCEASWDRYVASVDEAIQKTGARELRIDYPSLWHDDPLFIEAWSERVRASIARLDELGQSRAEIVFTAHSIPVAMAKESRYVEQLNESSRLVAQALNWNDWSISYQSRSGDGREPWLGPELAEVLKTIGRPAIVAPIGFVCDHVEVLYDLDVEAAMVARKSGIAMVRAHTVGDHPKFIEMIASMVTSAKTD